MLIITQAQKNQLTMTLFDLKTGTTAIYLCEFINKAELKAYYTVATDLSSKMHSYSVFCITEAGNKAYNPLNGEIYLPLQGDYIYNIYENPSSSLDPTGLKRCETGILRVVGDNPITTAPSYSANTEMQFFNINQYE